MAHRLVGGILLASCGARRAALILGGLLAGALLVELAARLLYTRPWYERLIDEQQRHAFVEPPLNQYGMRGPGYAGAKGAHRRVLVMGDSFTYGFGVTDEEALFPRRLERMLDAKFPRCSTAA